MSVLHSRSRRRLRPSAPRSTSALSFADLMVNLLTFFVLLFAWSKPTDGARFSAGLGGFLHHLDSWGLPPSAEDEQRREERIRELAGRFRALAPHRAPEREAPGAPLALELPFAEAGLVPGVARFAPGSDELHEDAKLAELARVLLTRPGWRARLEIALPDPADTATEALAERRLAAGFTRLLAAGVQPKQISTARVAVREPAPTERLDLRLLRDADQR